MTDHERLVLAALTDRERQVMALVRRGLSNKQIARILSVADGTVKVHMHRIFDKLAIQNRTMLATMATESAGAAADREPCRPDGRRRARPRGDGERTR